MADRRSRETRWIDWMRALESVRPGQRVRLGIGDDAALWRPRRPATAVLTVDVQAEGTHFRPGWLRPRELGRRSVNVALSDLAAMGARPEALLVSLLLPPDLRTAAFRELYLGISETAARYGAPIAGGNLSRGPLSVTIVALGLETPGGSLRRSGARRGDEIWVTGAPGLARLGLLALCGHPKLPRRETAVRAAIEAFKAPRARIDEALWLKRAGCVRAMIDLSDGLWLDLGHLLREAADRPAGLELDAGALETLAPTAPLCRRAGLSVAGLALAGGEDYELCFAAPSGALTAGRARAFGRRFRLALTRLGRIVPAPGIWLLEGGRRRRALPPAPYEHFDPAG